VVSHLGEEVEEISSQGRSSKFCILRKTKIQMTFKAIIHEAEEGGYWAEVPAIPGCVTQGDSIEDLRKKFERSD
jgi:Uncharacterized conserved protein